MASKLYDVLSLWIAWHLHEAQGSFCHCSDGSSEDWIRDVVEFLVKISRLNASALGSSGPALSPALISCSASYSSSFIFILRGRLGSDHHLRSYPKFHWGHAGWEHPFLLIDHGDQTF